MVDVAWAERLGSATLDAVLMKHFAAEFDEKHMAGGGSLLDYPKAVAKLRKQVRRGRVAQSGAHAAASTGL